MEFHKQKETKDGLHSWCKVCKLEKRATYRNPKFYDNRKMTISKTSGVYGIFSNGECLYIGESSKAQDRVKTHKWRMKNHTKSYLTKAEKILYKHLTNHKHIIFGMLEETENYKTREQYYINQLKPLYNVSI